MSATDKRPRRPFPWLRVLFTLGLLGLFGVSLGRGEGGLRGGVSALIHAFRDLDTFWVVLAGSLHLVGFSLVSLRWGMMLRAQGIPSTWAILLRVYITASFFNTFMPSTVGGDAYRVLYLRRRSGGSAMPLTVVLLERISGLVALMLIAFVASLFHGARGRGFLGSLLWLAGGVLFLALAAWMIHPRRASWLGERVLPRLPARLGRFGREVLDAYLNLAGTPGVPLRVMLVSLVFQANMVVYYYAIARALGEDPALTVFAMTAPIFIFLLMVVPAINGMGVRTMGFSQLMAFTTAHALMGEGLDLALRLCYGLLGGVLYLLGDGREERRSKG